MVFVRFTSTTPLIPTMTAPWIALLIFMILYCIMNGNISFNRYLVLFLFSAVLGLLIMRPKPYFRSWERLIGFTLNIALLSPLIKSDSFDEVKKRLFSFTFIGLKIIMFASFIAYFLGINLADKYSHDAYWAFGGITNQSMVLAPISAMCLIQGVWTLVTRDINMRYKMFLVIQCLCSIWCILVAGSRGSMLGAIASIAIIFFHYGSFKHIIKYVSIPLIVAMFLPGSILDKAFYTINIKQENHAISASNIASTREQKWIARTKEFMENPIFGCGFASQTHFTDDDIMSYILETGGLEPGSSWLSILAMTGILGFITLGGLIIKTTRQLWVSSRNNTNAIFFLALWIFYLFNGMMEGWVFYSGGFVFFIWWLLFGTIASCSKDNYAIKIY